MQPIQATLQKRLNQHKLTPVVQAAMVVSFANDYLKKALQEEDQIQVMRLKKTVLWVEVGHPILAQKVWNLSLPLLQELAQQYPQLKVSCLRTKALTVR